MGVSTGVTVSDTQYNSGFGYTGNNEPEQTCIQLQTIYYAPEGSTLSLYVRGGAGDIIINDARFFVNLMI